jgi:hypothetical protein
MNLLYHAVRETGADEAIKIATAAGGWFASQYSDG